MPFIFYLFGALGLAGGTMIVVNGAGTGNSTAAGFAILYGGSVFAGGLALIGLGRILDYLAKISRNSRDLRYLALLDPQNAADRVAEIEDEEARRADRASRTLFGFGPKRA